MTKKTTVKKEKDFNETMHTYGRAWSAVAVILMLLVPLFIALYFNTAPDMRGLIMGSISICIIYLPSSIIEVVTYAPMIGTGATYLAFITGNLTTLKVPCAMNARELAGTEYGTKENEIISTLSVAVSSLVSTLVLLAGVLLLVPLTPIISSPTLQPAFNMVVPALFGALGYKYFSKAPLVAVAPFACMALLCLLVPAAAGQVAVLVPVSALISIGIARVLYVKGKI